MKSMTGFGRGASTGDGYSVSVELRTVNNRFLDVNLRLFGDAQQLEPVLKNAVAARLTRGRVEVNLSYERSDEITYELNRPMIAGYLSAMKMARDEFELAGEPDINVIARLPNALLPKKDELSSELVAAVTEAVNLALDDLENMRADEGSILAKELKERLNDIEKRLNIIAREAESVPDEYRVRLTKRIEDLLAKSDSQIEIDQGRLAQEIAYLSDRSDISEEITRLSAHIQHFRGIMLEKRDVGKRLDFLTQELNREANTITSKTSNMNIKENALEIKSDIEKIREQVQNIE